MPVKEGPTVRRERITQRAFQVFEDEAEAREWLSRPNPALNNERPIAVAETADGEKLVKLVLGRLEHGVYT